MGKIYKKRSLGVNAVLNAIKSAMSVLFPLITYPYAFRVLHAEGIGKVDYVNSIVSYFSLIAALGISTYAIREGAKVRNDKKLFSEFSNEIFSINIITTLIAYIALALFTLFSSSFRSYGWLVVILSFSIFFTTMGIEWVNTVYEDFLYITVRSIVIHIVNLVLLFVLVHDEGDYYRYAFLSIISTGLTCVCNWRYCRKYVHLRLTRKLNIRKHIGPILALFVNSVAVKIYVNSDTTMLGWMASDYAVGIYSVAVKIYTVVKTMLSAIYSVAIPRISSYAASNDTKKIKYVYTSIMSGMILILLPACVGLICLSREVILFMGGTEYLEAVNTLRILSVSLVGAILGGTITYCLNIPLGREKINVIATTISAVINVGLNMILIPLYRWNGAAVTTAISEFFVYFFCVISFKNFREYLDIQKLFSNILHAVIGAITIIVINIAVRKLIANMWIIIITEIVIGISLYMIELIIFKNDFALEFLIKIKRKFGKNN